MSSPFRKQGLFRNNGRLISFAPALFVGARGVLAKQVCLSRFVVMKPEFLDFLFSERME